MVCILLSQASQIYKLMKPQQTLGSKTIEHPFFISICTEHQKKMESLSPQNLLLSVKQYNVLRTVIFETFFPVLIGWSVIQISNAIASKRLSNGHRVFANRTFHTSFLLPFIILKGIYTALTLLLESNVGTAQVDINSPVIADSYEEFMDGLVLGEGSHRYGTLLPMLLTASSVCSVSSTVSSLNKGSYNVSALYRKAVTNVNLTSELALTDGTSLNATDVDCVGNIRREEYHVVTGYATDKFEPYEKVTLSTGALTVVKTGDSDLRFLARGSSNVCFQVSDISASRMCADMNITCFGELRTTVTTDRFFVGQVIYFVDIFERVRSELDGDFSIDVNLTELLESGFPEEGIFLRQRASFSCAMIGEISAKVEWDLENDHEIANIESGRVEIECDLAILTRVPISVTEEELLLLALYKPNSGAITGYSSIAYLGTLPAVKQFAEGGRSILFSTKGEYQKYVETREVASSSMIYELCLVMFTIVVLIIVLILRIFKFHVTVMDMTDRIVASCFSEMNVAGSNEKPGKSYLCLSRKETGFHLGLSGEPEEYDGVSKIV